jgi:hypothetical protein
VTAAVPFIPLSALLGLFAPTIAVTRRAATRTVSEAGTAGDSTGPSTGSSAFQLLLGSPSDPAAVLRQTPPATVRGIPWSSAAPLAEPSGSSPRKPVLAATPQSPTSPAVSSESAAAPSSPSPEPAGSRLAVGDTEPVAPRRIPVVNFGTAAAGESAVSSGFASSSGYAVSSQPKDHSLTASAGAAAEAGNCSQPVATVAGAPGQRVPQTPQNRTRVKPAAAPDDSGPGKKAESVGSTSHRDPPQHSSVQTVPATGETPVLTPQAVIPQPTRAMDPGTFPNAAPSVGTPSQAPDPGTARSDSAPMRRRLADRQPASDTAATTSALRTDIPSAQSSSGIPLGSPPVTALEFPATRPEASELAPPSSHTPSESRHAAGADRSPLAEPQHESALRTESSGKSVRLAGLQLSPVSRAATSAPLAFQMKLTTSDATSLAGPAVAAGVSAPAPSRSRTAPYQEADPASASAPVFGDPAGANSTGGQMAEAGAYRDASIGDAPPANRPEMASSSRGASRAEPTGTTAAPAEALTTEAGNLLFAMSSAQPPLHPTARAIAEDSPAPPQPPVEQLAPALRPATPVNREIQLQVGSGPSGVAVRVAVRAGEIRVDVRTPDSQLTSTLRQELPTLATRLTESGFNAAIWHPVSASASAFSRDATETSTPANADDQGGRGQGQPQQQSGRQPPDERPQQSSPSQQTNTNRKDFQWLFTSLQ